MIFDGELLPLGGELPKYIIDAIGEDAFFDGLMNLQNIYVTLPYCRVMDTEEYLDRKAETDAGKVGKCCKFERIVEFHGLLECQMFPGINFQNLIYGETLDQGYEAFTDILEGYYAKAHTNKHLYVVQQMFSYDR